MLEVLHGVEGVLQGLGHILLYILGSGTLVYGDDHNGVGVDIRI